MTDWWLATDCEGPLTLNDYAYELCAAYVPQGDKLFEVLSRYDDYLVEVERRPAHAAGSTLRWVAPFLKAFGLTEAAARDFAASRLLVVPGLAKVLPAVQALLPIFVISASYRQYLEALCSTLAFPQEQIFATPLPLDSYPLPERAAERLRSLAAVLAALPPLAWPAGARGAADLAGPQRESLQVLEAALEELEALAGSLMEAITVIGGPGKARALQEIAARLRSRLAAALYIGDSITDVEALRLVREAGGVAVAFNANRYALAAAEVACLSAHAGPLLALAAAQAAGGPAEVRRLVASWPKPDLPAPLRGLWQEEWAAAELVFIAAQDFGELVARSEAFRREIRGEAIGGLG